MELNEADVVATGFRVDATSWRIAIGEREPCERGDEIYLRLATEVRDDADAAPIVAAVRFASQTLRAT